MKHDTCVTHDVTVTVYTDAVFVKLTFLHVWIIIMHLNHNVLSGSWTSSGIGSILRVHKVLYTYVL